MYDHLTTEEIKTRLYLAELSQSALKRKLEKVTRVSRSRLKRMNQRGRLLIEARAMLFRLTRETSGG